MRLIFLCLSLTACDAIDKKLHEESYDVTCYSGDTLIYHGYGAGRAGLEQHLARVGEGHEEVCPGAR